METALVKTNTINEKLSLKIVQRGEKWETEPLGVNIRVDEQLQQSSGI